MRISLDRHQLVDFDAAVSGHAPYIVALEVDQHHMLGALLLVADKLFGIRKILLLACSPRPRACNRPGLDNACVDSKKLFRRGACYCETRELEVAHIGGWIDLPERAVDLERVPGVGLAKADREIDLKDISGDDVLPRTLDHSLELETADALHTACTIHPLRNPW